MAFCSLMCARGFGSKIKMAAEINEFVGDRNSPPAVKLTKQTKRKSKFYQVPLDQKGCKWKMGFYYKIADKTIQKW